LPPELIAVAPQEVRRSPHQARTEFDARALEGLAQSLRLHGMLQPIVVRRTPDGYELIAGERRLRAAVAAGLTSIPALVREASPLESAMAGLVENLQRSDLGVFEEAEAYRRVMAEFGLTQSELGRRIGRSQSAIANKLRLLQLGDEIRALAVQGSLTERHLRALLRVAGVRRLELARAAAREGWTARELEARTQDISREMPRRFVRDVRIVRNALRESVRRLQAAGVAVEMTETEAEDALELRLRISRG
jgi:ParB family chromosome partitioning protein